MTRAPFSIARLTARILARGRRAALICALGLAALPGAARAEEALRIGVLDYLGSEHSLTHWASTEQALNAALPEHRFRLVALDLAQLDAALAADELDFVITNPGDYAELEYRYRISRIATAEDDLPVASTLVTAGALDTLGDLAGKRLAIVSPEAFGGFQVIWSELVDVSPALPAKVELVVSGYPMQTAARAVLDGAADAAVLRACLLEELQRDDPARYASLHAFALQPSEATTCAVSSPFYPGWPFAKTRTTSPELSKQVAVALMQMQADTLWTVPLDYQPVHDLMRKLQIGPYARTGPVSIRDFIADYRDWLIVLAVALVFWALYSVRIEALVRHRTRALNETNLRLINEMAERQRAEEADRLHRRELDHVARLSILGEMASSIAHELNQPLAAISNYAQGLLVRLRGENSTPQDLERAATEIAEQSDRAATVIRRIRAFVRKRESQMAPLEMRDLLDECAALYSAPVHRAGIDVSVRCADDLPPVTGDKVQLTQVVLNLVQNAVDAMADTPGEARRIMISAERHRDPVEGAGLRLTVRDHGTGMDAAAMDHFAEAFYSTKSEGIGLGLALSRSIVEAHGGWLRAETPEDGPGLRVALWLPEGIRTDGD